MRLTPAKRRDARRLARILADWIDETPWMPTIHTPDQDRSFLAWLITNTEVVTLRSWRGPQGFLAREDTMVHALYLRPAVRGQGHGKRLLDWAKARSPNLTLWTFQANAGARAFYAREGFREVEMTDGAGNDEGVPDVRLVWPAERGGA
ncbi:MAG: GNAT family N-acetyltransferase [Rhodobacter sp.]|nr:GNAT family N-acetyltransferase [Rhodobacter sp.]